MLVLGAKLKEEVPCGEISKSEESVDFLFWERRERREDV